MLPSYLQLTFSYNFIRPQLYTHPHLHHPPTHPHLLTYTHAHTHTHTHKQKGCTALLLAAEFQHEDVVELLIEVDADPDLQVKVITR